MKNLGLLIGLQVFYFTFQTGKKEHDWISLIVALGPASDQAFFGPKECQLLTCRQALRLERSASDRTVRTA
jgi:hypothetical protein